MTESRQQRRARERAEQKSANRPGPNLRVAPEPEPAPEPVGEKQEAVIDIEVSWRQIRRSPNDSHWQAHWTERDSDMVGSDESSGDLEDFLSQTAEEILDEYPGHDLTFVWELDAEAQSELDTQGVTLPVSYRSGFIFEP